jgi:hypothetical protein
MSKRKATAAPEAEPVAKRWDGDNDVRVAAFLTPLAFLSEFYRLSRPYELAFKTDIEAVGWDYVVQYDGVVYGCRGAGLNALHNWMRVVTFPTLLCFRAYNFTTNVGTPYRPLVPYSSYPAWQLASIDHRAVVRFAHTMGVLLSLDREVPLPDYYIRHYPWWRHWVLKGLQKKTCEDIVHKVFEFIGLPLHSL